MPASFEARLQLRDRPVDVALAALAARVEELRELAEALRLEDLEREVLELPLDLPDPEPLRERGVDLHRLAGDPLLLLRRQGVQRPHVVEPIGELDEDDADVLRHRQQHLPDVLGLLLLVAVGAELRQLRDAVDEAGDLRAEALLDVRQAVLGVLGDVVEERRLDRDRVDAELGGDLGRRDRVGHVRLAGRPALALVGLDGEVERLADGFEVRLRVVARDRGEQLLPERCEIRLLGLARGGRRRRPTRTARLGPRGAGLAGRHSVVGRGRRTGLSHRRRIAAALRGPRVRQARSNAMPRSRRRR